MTLKASTGLRTAMLDTGSLVDAFTTPVILIYGGTVPASADATVGSATLLSTITGPSSAELEFDAASAGSLPKAAAQAWAGVNAATGTATFFRLVSAADDALASTIEPRLQGTCGTAGADLNMTSVNLTSGATQTIDAATITLPTF